MQLCTNNFDGVTKQKLIWDGQQKGSEGQVSGGRKKIATGPSAEWRGYVGGGGQRPTMEVSLSRDNNH